MNDLIKTRIFKLTKKALKEYKKSNPLARARNPRPSYFAGQWDLNWGITVWFLNVIYIMCMFVIDLILLPFQIIGMIRIKKDKARS